MHILQVLNNFAKGLARISTSELRLNKARYVGHNNGTLIWKKVVSIWKNSVRWGVYWNILEVKFREKSKKTGTSARTIPFGATPFFACLTSHFVVSFPSAFIWTQLFFKTMSLYNMVNGHKITLNFMSYSWTEFGGFVDFFSGFLMMSWTEEPVVRARARDMFSSLSL